MVNEVNVVIYMDFLKNLIVKSLIMVLLTIKNL